MDGHKTTVTFGTSGFSASLASIDGPGLKRESINETYMDTEEAEIFEPAALYDGGEFTFNIKHTTNQLPPVASTDVNETITIDWAGQGAGHRWSFDGHVTGYSAGAQSKNRMEGKLTVKVSGEISVS